MTDPGAVRTEYLVRAGRGPVHCRVRVRTPTIPGINGMRAFSWPVLASATLLAGGASWLVKIGVIVATDGRVITTGPAAALMSAGLVLLALGAAGLGAALPRRAHVLLRAGGAVAGVVVVAGCCLALAWGASRLLKGHGPPYFAQEAGILAAALLWLGVGALGLRSFGRPAPTG